MPTENEMKFVLLIESEKEISKLCKNCFEIKQAYIAANHGMSLRIREKKHLKSSRRDKYEICFKQKIGKRVLEIENQIDVRDFEDLWSVAMNRLDKIRYNLIIRKKKVDYLWEIDFFKDHGQNTYFALAEHEMPENQLKPDFIPDIIKKHLVFEVPITDGRFASKRLADVKHAKELYNQIRSKKNEKCRKGS